MQQRPYTREEHFHAIEKPELRPLPATPYQMKRYAEVTVQQNGHVYLSCDKHYYSVPYTLIGNKAKIIFTSSLVKIYVRGECVATHRRDRSYGYTSVHQTFRLILQDPGKERIRESVQTVRCDVLKYKRHISS